MIFIAPLNGKENQLFFFPMALSCQYRRLLYILSVRWNLYITTIFTEHNIFPMQILLYRKKNPKYSQFIDWCQFSVYLFSAFLVDASSSNEAVHLQQRLKSLSSELVTLRNRLHVDQTNVDVPLNGDAAPTSAVAAAATALNLVTAQPTPQPPPPTSHHTNGPFATNHTNMQIGSSTILPVAKTNPKVNLALPWFVQVSICALCQYKATNILSSTYEGILSETIKQFVSVIRLCLWGLLHHVDTCYGMQCLNCLFFALYHIQSMGFCLIIFIFILVFLACFTLIDLDRRHIKCHPTHYHMELIPFQ